jgi:hypothetical protein
MPQWLVTLLESRQEVADAARRRAEQYPNFAIQGLDTEIGMQINGFHALIRAQCETLALREEFYIEDVRRMWRVFRTYPGYDLVTPWPGEPQPRATEEGAV